MNDSKVPILLKNSFIWMRDFSDENQITLNVSYKLAPEFNSDVVRTERDKYDPLRVLGSIERLKRKWVCPVGKFRVFQQNLPKAALYIPQESGGSNLPK